MKKYISEFVGTMMLVLLACGVAVVVGCSTPAGIITTALAFGLVIVAMAYSIGNVSGCHINPAVSLSMVVAGGANGFGSLLPNGTKVTWYIALIVEIILTFVFVTAILGVTDKKENGHATGIVIGLTLTLVHLFGIPFTGTSVNPARSFGPALLQGGKALSQVWVFIVAPIIGSILAGLFYKFVLKKGK